MTVGLMRTDRQHRVQQQHTLPGPVGQISVGGHRYVQRIVQLTKDVFERWRRCDPPANRKTQTVRLIGPVVRILTQNDDPNPIERSVVKRVEDLTPGGKDAVIRLFFDQKSA